MRANRKFSRAINVILPVQSLLAKIFRFRRRANHLYRFARLGPHEGRIAIVTDVGHEMRWTRQRRARKGSQGGSLLTCEQSKARGRQMLLADGKSVWSWHPLLVSSWRRQVGPTGRGHVAHSPTTVTRRIRHTRARYKPLKSLRLNPPGESGGPVVTTLVCFLLVAREAAGASGTRCSPRPLFCWAKVFLHNSGAIRAAGRRTCIFSLETLFEK